MSTSSQSLARAAPFVLPLLAAGALGAAVHALPADTPALWRLLLLVIAAAAGGLSRAITFGLGAGAAALPLARDLFGWGGAAVVATAAAALTRITPVISSSGERRSSRSRLRRTITDTVLHGLAGTGAALAWGMPLPAPLRPLAAALAWLVLLAGLPPLQRRLARIPAPPAPWRRLGGLVLDAGGWATGALLMAVQARSGWTLTFVLLLTFSLLAAETGRQRQLRRRAEVGREALERLGRAGERLVASPSATADVAVRVLQECRQVLPFSWFHLEVTLPGTATGSWHAGPDGRLREGWPRPPAHAPPLPGVHRRAAWDVLERRLLSGGVELARLTLWCDPRRLRPEAVPLFEQLLPQLAGLVHRSELDRQANQDPLTGVALRRVLDVRLAASFECSREGGEPLALALLDLDFFKRINDRFGHAAGDRALVAVADELRRHLRDNDLCARYGGEEFTLLFPGLTGSAALTIVERLRGQVEELQVEVDGARLPLSLSAGVAAYPEVPCRTAEELLQLADEALYEAKRLGRNCCLLHAGRGRYVDGKGRDVDTGEESAPRAPQIFA